MGVNLEVYRVQPWTKSLVKSQYPRLDVREDSELCFTAQNWGNVLDRREWFTSRVADGQTVRVPSDNMLPVYETSLEDRTRKVLLGTIQVPTMYITSYGAVPLWLALANGAADLATFRREMRDYKPDIKPSWPVSFYQLSVADFVPHQE